MPHPCRREPTCVDSIVMKMQTFDLSEINAPAVAIMKFRMMNCHIRRAFDRQSVQLTAVVLTLRKLRRARTNVPILSETARSFDCHVLGITVKSNRG